VNCAASDARCRFAQGLAQGPLQGGFVGFEAGGVGAQLQVRLHQALVARQHRRVALQQQPGPALVVARPVAHRPGVGREQRQPAVQLVIQRRIGKHRQACRQAQAVTVAGRQGGLLAGAGDTHQQVAAQQQVALAGRLQRHPASAAQGAEQQGQAALMVRQRDLRLGEIDIGTAGDEAVPDAADPLFQFQGKGHEPCSKRKTARCTSRAALLGIDDQYTIGAGAPATAWRWRKLYR